MRDLSVMGDTGGRDGPALAKTGLERGTPALVTSSLVTSWCDLRTCVGSARRGIKEARGDVVLCSPDAPSVPAVKAP